MLVFSGMSTWQGNSSNRGGRGRGKPPYRGGKVLAIHGNQKLIASDLSTVSKTEMEEFKAWQLQKRSDTPESSLRPSYAGVVHNKEQKDHEMMPNKYSRVILYLEKHDLRRTNDPWSLYDRYLSPYGYTMETYKTRMFYEELLRANGCEFTHFTGTNTEIYNFSKIVIKKIISIEEWGISPFKIKMLKNKENNSSINYCYWDYIQAFDKVFLYENDKRTHTWFIKICPGVYNSPLPTWLINWWMFYGTSEMILPDFIFDYFNEWVRLKPETEDDNIVPNDMRFFIEFSIPWIWRFEPVIGRDNSLDENIPCLKRRAFSRFWEAMVQPNAQKELKGADTFKLITDKIDSLKKALKGKETLKNEEGVKLLRDTEAGIDIYGASEEEIKKAFLQSMARALKARKQYEDFHRGDSDKKSTTSDVSMASNASHNSFDILQDSQPNDTELSNMSIEQLDALLAEDEDEAAKKARIAFITGKNA